MLVAAYLLATFSSTASASAPAVPSPHPLPRTPVADHATLRHLQRSADAEEAAVVTTPLELLSAITAGAAHVELTDHLDLTNLLASGGAGRVSEAAAEDGMSVDGAEGPMAAATMQAGGVYSSLAYLLGTLPPTVKSIRVRISPTRVVTGHMVLGGAMCCVLCCVVCCDVWLECFLCAVARWKMLALASDEPTAVSPAGCMPPKFAPERRCIFCIGFPGKGGRQVCR